MPAGSQVIEMPSFAMDAVLLVVMPTTYINVSYHSSTKFLPLTKIKNSYRLTV